MLLIADTRYSLALNLLFQIRTDLLKATLISQHLHRSTQKIGHIFITEQILKRFHWFLFAARNNFLILDHYNYLPLLSKCLEAPQDYYRHTIPTFLCASTCLTDHLPISQMGTEVGKKNNQNPIIHQRGKRTIC